jgi:TolA-binding protein
MLRFLLPAFLMVGALVALFAGAFGDWHGVSDSWNRLHTVIARLAHDPAAATPSSAVSPTAPSAVVQTAPAAGDDPQQSAADALRQQVTGLQAQIAQRTQELASLHANTDQARQELETLRQQQQVAATLNTLRQDQARQADARARARRHPRGSSAVPAPPAFASTQAGPVVPPWTQLMAAREVLANGRKQDARQLLATAETQMVLRPVAPDEPETMGGNRAATAVEEAIHMLDTGDINLAFQAINRAIDITKSQGSDARSAVPTPAAPPYPPPAGYRFANQP